MMGVRSRANAGPIDGWPKIARSSHHPAIVSKALSWCVLAIIQSTNSFPARTTVCRRGAFWDWGRLSQDPPRPSYLLRRVALPEDNIPKGCDGDTITADLWYQQVRLFQYGDDHCDDFSLEELERSYHTYSQGNSCLGRDSVAELSARLFAPLLPNSSAFPPSNGAYYGER